MLNLNTSVEELSMVGKQYSSRLKKLGIIKIEDLLHHYPSRYEDYSQIYTINQLKPGLKGTVIAKIFTCQNVFTKYGKKLQKAIIVDKTGQLAVTWFNQPYLTNILKPETNIALSGEIAKYNNQKAFVSPEFELVNNKLGLIHTARLVPIYPETYGLSSKWLRSRIWQVLFQSVLNISDYLPQELKNKYQLIELFQSLKKIHFPKNFHEIEEAKKRLAFDEMFVLQLAALQRKKTWQKNIIRQPFLIDQDKMGQFFGSLPFVLTNSQKTVIKEILADLAKNKPMNRLIQGDVGSGKTVVAALAIYITYLNNYKSLLMAPTEILAQQHYKTLSFLLKPLGISIGLITGQMNKNKINLNKLDLIVGTHSLIYLKSKLNKIGLVIIDEQHRFGVEQRAKLLQKGFFPHLLTLTATPIPRTIALTVFGDLDVSYILKMPKGRKQVKTWVVADNKKNAAYEWIKSQIKKGEQAFIVCPLIELSEKESMKELKAAKEEYSKLSTQVFNQCKVGLLHGRLKSLEKQAVLKQFGDKQIDILVCTPVVEVGIDFPNATVMMVEAAERFGLAQLHQLRGRVGRSHKQSYCLLFSTIRNPQNIKRLKAMEKFYSGFELAEVDLRLRGPGEIYGTTQHGFYNLKMASFNNPVLINQTREAVNLIIDRIYHFPLLNAKLKSYTIKSVEPN